MIDVFCVEGFVCDALLDDDMIFCKDDVCHLTVLGFVYIHYIHNCSNNYYCSHV